MSDTLKSLKRFERFIGVLSGVIALTLFAIVGISLLLFSSDVANKILGAAFAVGCTAGLYKTFQAFKRGDYLLEGKWTVTCAGCQHEYSIIRKKSSDPEEGCPQCGRAFNEQA